MANLLELVRTGTDTDAQHTETAHEAASKEILSLDRQRLTEIQTGLQRALERSQSDTTVRTRIELLKARVDLQLAITNRPTSFEAAGTIISDGASAIGNTARGGNNLLERGANLIPSEIRTVGILAAGATAFYAIPRFFHKLFTGRWSEETPEQVAKRQAQEKERKAKIEAEGGVYRAPREGASLGRKIFAGLGTGVAAIAGLFALHHVGSNSTNTPPSTPTV